MFAFNSKSVFIGNYDSGYFGFLLKLYSSKVKRVLLDDGNKSIRLYDELSSSCKFEFFTAFDLSVSNDASVVKNTYSGIKSIINNNRAKTDSVLFIGSGMAEIGIVTEQYYLQLMGKIASYYKAKDLGVIYIPHRAESPIKLKQISERFKVDLMYLDYPVEFFGLFNDFSPTVISSFCSTALTTLKDIYGYSVESFTFDYVGHADENELDKLYEYYRADGIPVKEFLLL